MEIYYIHKGVTVRLYNDGPTVWAEKDGVNTHCDTYLVREFSSSDNAVAYVDSIRVEKLTEAHAEALRMNAEISTATTATEYVIENVGNSGIGFNYATFYEGELESARDLVFLLREKGHTVRLVKRVTASEVIS